MSYRSNDHIVAIGVDLATETSRSVMVLCKKAELREAARSDILSGRVVLVPGFKPPVFSRYEPTEEVDEP